MFDEEDSNFIKVFLILMKGGTPLCRKILQSLVAKSGKSLEKILQEKRQDLTDTCEVGHLTRAQLQKLFPRNSRPIDIDQWDISLLTFVLLNVFRTSFKSPEIAAIKAIRDRRNNVIGHGSNTKITNQDFACVWPHITLALRQLSRMLTPDDQMEYITTESRIIVHPFHLDSIEELEEVEPDLFNICFMPKVTCNNRRRNEEIFRRIELIEKTQAEHAKLQHEQGKLQHKQEQKIEILARMQVITSCTRSRRQVQDHILEASNNIIANGPDTDSSDDEVLLAVRELFKGMEDQRVTIVKAEEGSVLLTILCPTIKSLLDVSHYLNSPEIQTHLTALEEAVATCHGCVTKLVTEIDLNSLKTAIKSLEKDLDVGTVYLTLECSGISGIRNAFQMFENGESTNTLNKLSEALSHTVGQRVELETEIDIDKLEDDIENVTRMQNDQMNDKGQVQREEEMKQNLATNKQKDDKSEIKDDFEGRRHKRIRQEEKRSIEKNKLQLKELKELIIISEKRQKLEKERKRRQEEKRREKLTEELDEEMRKEQLKECDQRMKKTTQEEEQMQMAKLMELRQKGEIKDMKQEKEMIEKRTEYDRRMKEITKEEKQTQLFVGTAETAQGATAGGVADVAPEEALEPLSLFVGGEQGERRSTTSSKKNDNKNK